MSIRGHGTAREGRSRMNAAKRGGFAAVDLVYVSAGAALITVCSWITIPLPGVPITMQTFAVFLILGLLGGARGTLAVLVYIAAGAVGLPVFSGFRGGVGALLGATGGYIAGFAASALFYWAAAAVIKRPALAKAVGMAGGLLVCYAFGTFWFAAVYSSADGAAGVGAALMKCVVPFLAPDAVKLSLAFWLSGILSKRIGPGR